MSSFWEQLLNRSRERTRLLDGVTAKPRVRLFKSADAAVGGLRFVYFVGLSEMQVALEINRPQAESKRLFDQLFASKADIGASFGEPLVWLRREDNNRSRIESNMPCPGVAAESEWPQMIDRLIDAAVRFETALRPHLNRLTLS